MYRDLLRPAPAGEGRPGAHRGRTAPRERADGGHTACMPRRAWRQCSILRPTQRCQSGAASARTRPHRPSPSGYM